LNVGPSRYDIGMYINTEGGSALTGTCALALLSQTDFQLGSVAPEVINFSGGDVTIGELETGADADKCPDYTNTVNGGATLSDFPFAPIRLACVDTTGDGLLDFDIAIGWRQNAGTYCSPDSTSTWPIPGASSKCWRGERFSVPVEVPPWNTVSRSNTWSFSYVNKLIISH
jgi:hypothetical protein